MTTTIIATLTALAITYEVRLLLWSLNDASKEHAKWLQQKSHR